MVIIIIQHPQWHSKVVVKISSELSTIMRTTPLTPKGPREISVNYAVLFIPPHTPTVKNLMLNIAFIKNVFFFPTHLSYV